MLALSSNHLSILLKMKVLGTDAFVHISQSGVMESRHRRIVDKRLTLLFQYQVLFRFWPFKTTVHLLNIMPTKEVSPYKLLYAKPYDLSKTRIFGCQCFPCLRPYTKNKLKAYFVACTFLRYGTKQRGFICYDMTHDKFYRSRHVIFNESTFPFGNSCSVFETTFENVNTSTLQAPRCLPVVPSSSTLVLDPYP